MSPELFWWGYVIITVCFGVPYAMHHADLREDDNIGTAFVVGLMCSVLWPAVVVHTLTHKQDIKALKRAKVHERNAKLIQLQLDQHKLAIKERKARHQTALAEFDANFPKVPIRQEFGPNPLAWGSAQDRFMQRALQTTPTHHELGPCWMQDGQKNYLATMDETQVTCPRCFDWLPEESHR